MTDHIVIEAGKSHPDVEGIPIEKMTSAQLHLYAEYFNWDDDCKPMFTVIWQPKCDLGTALMIYWKADPHFYCAYATRSEADEWMREVYDLLTEIEQKVEDGFYKRRRIAFDPRNDNGDDWTIDTDPKTEKKVEIPECMYQAVKPRGRKSARGTKKKTKK
jgi:hypothetical protein